MEKKITLWAARDNYKEGRSEVRLYKEEPHCEKINDDYVFFGGVGLADTTWCFGKAFDSITFENSPVEVELTIKVKE